jgi:hypothetical protein
MLCLWRVYVQAEVKEGRFMQASHSQNKHESDRRASRHQNDSHSNMLTASPLKQVGCREMSFTSLVSTRFIESRLKQFGCR